MGFAEQLARLKGLLSKAEGMEMLSNPNLYKLTLQQILGETEILAKKKRHEAENVRQQIVACEAQALAFEQIGQIVGNLVEVLISREEQVRAETKRQEEERRSASEGPSGPSVPSVGEPSTPPKRRGRPPKDK